MLPSIPTEASYAQWLVSCMERYFEALGFTLYSEIQSQNLEHDYPFDIYVNISKGNIVKRFGLQVKRPYLTRSRARRIYWILKEKQHTDMKKYSWIYYALPDFVERKYFKVACYHIMFKRPGFKYKRNFYKREAWIYERFGSFSKKVINCTIGQELNEEGEWIDSLSLFKELEFKNQIHTYLDFTDMKGQIFTNIIEES